MLVLRKRSSLYPGVTEVASGAVVADRYRLILIYLGSFNKHDHMMCRLLVESDQLCSKLTLTLQYSIIKLFIYLAPHFMSQVLLFLSFS